MHRRSFLQFGPLLPFGFKEAIQAYSKLNTTTIPKKGPQLIPSGQPKIALTAFKPWGNFTYNSSLDLQGHYVNRPIDTSSLLKVQVDVSAKGCDDAIQTLLENEVEYVVMLGMDPHLDAKLRIELGTTNTHLVKQGHPRTCDALLRYSVPQAHAELLRAEAKAREIDVDFSNDAGPGYCGRLLCMAFENDLNAIFMHVPMPYDITNARLAVDMLISNPRDYNSEHRGIPSEDLRSQCLSNF